MSRLLAFLLLAIGLASCTTATAPDSSPAPSLDVPNFRVVEEGIAASGQPSPRGFTAASTRGYRTVVNFRTQAEGAGEEGTLVRGLGMRYVSIPVSGTDLGFAQADALAALLAEEDSTPPLLPVLLHCGSSNRVGAVWALYVRKHRGASVEEALAAGERAGLTKLHDRVEELLRTEPDPR